MIPFSELKHFNTSILFIILISACLLMTEQFRQSSLIKSCILYMFHTYSTLL